MSDSPVEIVFHGYAFVLETMNFCMFICLESIKFCLFGIGTACTEGDYDYAKWMDDQFYQRDYDELWSWIVMYAIPLNPIWDIYNSFLLASRERLSALQGTYNEGIKMTAAGYVLNSKNKWVPKGSSKDDTKKE